MAFKRGYDNIPFRDRIGFSSNDNPDNSMTLIRDCTDQVDKNDKLSFSPELQSSLILLDQILEDPRLDQETIFYIIERWPTLFDPDDRDSLVEISSFESKIGKPFIGESDLQFVSFLEHTNIIN